MHRFCGGKATILEYLVRRRSAPANLEIIASAPAIFHAIVDLRLHPLERRRLEHFFEGLLRDVAQRERRIRPGGVAHQLGRERIDISVHVYRDYPEWRSFVSLWRPVGVTPNG